MTFKNERELNNYISKVSHEFHGKRLAILYQSLLNCGVSRSELAKTVGVTRQSIEQVIAKYLPKGFLKTDYK